MGRSMNKLFLMEKIRAVYENGGNIIEYLSTLEGEKKTNSLEDILISYDFQAGNYYNAYKANPSYFSNQYDEMAAILGDYIEQCGEKCTILEGGGRRRQEPCFHFKPYRVFKSKKSIWI